MKKIIPTIVSVVTLGLVTGFPGQSHIAEAEEFTPYYGNGPSYIQPDNLSHLFPDPNVSFNTPAFKQRQDRLYEPRRNDWSYQVPLP